MTEGTLSMPKKKLTPEQLAVRDLANGLARLPDNWVMCRDMRHAWSVEHDFWVEPSQSVGRRTESIRRELVCMRCGTFRVEHYLSGRYGLDKVSQSYVYPTDYQIPGVPRGVKPSSVVQQEQFRRAMEKVAKAAAGERETSD